MRHLSIVALLAALAASGAPAQTWHREYVTRGQLLDVEERADGNVALLVVQNTLTTPCLQLAEIDRRGRVVRRVRTGEPSSLPWGCATSISDGGLVLVGRFGRGLPGTSISRLRPDLTSQWQVALRDASIACVAETPDGGFVLGGMEYRDRLAPARPVILRLDARGRVLWDRSWVRPVDAAVTDVALVPDGGVVAVVQHQFGGDDAFGVYGVDAGGLPRWQWWHPVEPTRLLERILVPRPDGSVLVAFASGASATSLWHVTFGVDGSVTDASRYSSASDIPSGVPLARPGGEMWTIDRVSLGTYGFRVVRLDASGEPQGGRYFDFGAFWSTSGAPALVSLPSAGLMASYELVAGGTARLMRIDAGGDMPACAGSDETLTRRTEPNPFVADDALSSVPGLRTLGWAIRLLPGFSWSSTVECEDLSGPPGEVSPPTSAAPLEFTGKTTLTWEDAALSGSDSFCLLRGSLPSLRAGDYGGCLQANLASPTATDTESPGLGAGWFYLVHGRNAFGDGPLGVASSPGPRLPSAPCP